MKPTEKSTLFCGIFGHNYVMTGPRHKPTTDLACKHCGHPLKIDANGNFSEEDFTNKEVLKVMRQLFHAKLKLAKSGIKL
ncbi:hypothetical protein [uncultured Winogradskyella sp.]|uniref:hypothetical protein n=1 Tax=uncultured Winogradskyella sp. TaxID=395353 RepID=UPI003517EEDD